jgi:alpha-beta hydrolase superfamily lysophospholipase
MIRFRYILFLLGLVFIFTACKQEKMLFYPEKLPIDHKFTFNSDFEEYYFPVDNKTTLNGLLFHADSSKGLVFYLHGNAGSIDSWGEIAGVYLNNNYDFFILDYRGYGKSQGKISSENQLYKDIQIVYDSLKTKYSENNIVVIGYSIGTGLAAHLASSNSPKMLILKAPYYNLPDLAHQYIKIIPTFLIRYKLRTNEFITKTKCPVIIFHGDQDEIIYVGSSYKLKELFKPEDRLIILKGQRHNGINDNPIYLERLREILK